MSVWPAPATEPPSLYGTEGELVSLLVSVDPRHLEELLETLAQLEFPVNPRITHNHSRVTVGFPAYSGRVDEVRKLLDRSGFDTACLEVAQALGGG